MRTGVRTAVMAMGLAATCALAQTNQTGNVSLQIRQFSWKEYVEGEQLLEESGLIYGLAINAGQRAGRFYPAIGLILSAGDVDYDGQTQSGEPAVTETTYLGMAIKADLVGRLAVNTNLSVRGFLGLGSEMWNRELQSTEQMQGYDELWLSSYGRIGAAVDRRFESALGVFAECGLKIPIYTLETADLRHIGLGYVNLRPQQQPSLFAELGMQWRCLTVNVFYDSLRFDASDTKQVCVYSPPNVYLTDVYQPESRADIWGVSIGLGSKF